MAQRNIFEHYGSVFGTGPCVIPELLALGWDEHTTSIRSLGPHVHPRAFEVCYIVSGSVDWWAGPQVYRVGRGDVYITGPGELHGGVDSMLHACELYFLQIAFPRRGALPGLTPQQTRLLRRGYESLQLRCFPGSADVHACFRRLLNEQRRGKSGSDIAARAVLHQLLVQVLRDHDAAIHARLTTGPRSPRILRAIEWMDRHIGEDYAVEDAARAVGLGVSRFHEQFLREVGYTPADYRARRRVELARHALRHSDEPITSMALRLGFSSSQYFATVFRKLAGMSPRAYRMSHVNNQPNA